MAKKSIKSAATMSDAPAPMPNKDYAAQERKYKTEEAVRTMERFAELQADKSLFSDAKKMAKQKMKVLGKVCK